MLTASGVCLAAWVPASVMTAVILGGLFGSLPLVSYGGTFTVTTLALLSGH